MKHAVSREDYGGAGEPAKGLVSNHGTDWTPGTAATARRAIARNVSQQGVGPQAATINTVKQLGHVTEPTFFWGG
jgi:hypothetical protein